MKTSVSDSPETMADNHPVYSRGSDHRGAAIEEGVKTIPERDKGGYEGVLAIRAIGQQLQGQNFPLPTEDDPLSENVEDRRAPVYTRAQYPTGAIGMFKQRKKPLAEAP